LTTTQKQRREIYDLSFIDDFFPTIFKLRGSCPDEVISNIGEKKILNYLRFVSKNKNTQIKLAWRQNDVDFCPFCECLEEEKNRNKKHRRNLSRLTAFKYAKTIHERLKSIDGVFLGIDSDFRYEIVMDAWVFGSMAKGSQNPNDLDILYNYKLLSIREEHGTIGIEDQFFKFITDGLKQVSLHDMDDNCLAKDHKIEIYPKFKLKL
jgi:predicted nucleotidyltransferase